MSSPQASANPSHVFSISMARHKSLLGNQQGFTLLETLVAMLVLLAALAGVVPLFMTYRLSIINNEEETGAIYISEQLMDQIRQVDASTMPTGGSYTALPSGVSIEEVDHLGKTYNPTITYCQNSTFCDTNSRHILIEVNRNGDEIYEVETVYTKFE
jgi:prepilin-type N-terminal cleavage/methylation domain-containing protein